MLYIVIGSWGGEPTRLVCQTYQEAVQYAEDCYDVTIYEISREMEYTPPVDED